MAQSNQSKNKTPTYVWLQETGVCGFPGITLTFFLPLFLHPVTDCSNCSKAKVKSATPKDNPLVWCRLVSPSDSDLKEVVSCQPPNQETAEFVITH